MKDKIVYVTKLNGAKEKVSDILSEINIPSLKIKEFVRIG